jgi:hypothetical protein
MENNFDLEKLGDVSRCFTRHLSKSMEQESAEADLNSRINSPHSEPTNPLATFRGPMTRTQIRAQMMELIAQIKNSRDLDQQKLK